MEPSEEMLALLRELRDVQTKILEIQRQAIDRHREQLELYKEQKETYVTDRETYLTDNKARDFDYAESQAREAARHAAQVVSDRRTHRILLVIALVGCLELAMLTCLSVLAWLK